jgi:hypothetical protein
MLFFHKAHLSLYKFNVEQATESESKKIRWRLAPTRREQDKWNRAAKAATDGSVSIYDLGRCRTWSSIHSLLLNQKW